LDELQAAILRIKLKKLDEYQKQRQTMLANYNEALQETDLVRPVTMDNVKHAWHLLYTAERKQTGYNRIPENPKGSNRYILSSSITFAKSVH